LLALELVVVAGDAVTLTTLPARGAVTLGRGERGSYSSAAA
jgi:hypothetical protein